MMHSSRIRDARFEKVSNGLIALINQIIYNVISKVHYQSARNSDKEQLCVRPLVEDNEVTSEEKSLHQEH